MLPDVRERPSRRERTRSRIDSFRSVDDALISAQAGDSDAFAYLYRHYGRLIHGYLRTQRVRDPEGSANEVFLRAFRSLPRFRGWEPDLRSWLISIAHNLVIDERRKQTRSPDLEPWDDHAEKRTSGADDFAHRAVGDDFVGQQLAKLAPDQRDVLVLRILSDLSLEQVADVLDKRVGAVKALQRRGLAALRRNLAAEGVPLELRDDVLWSDGDDGA